MATTSSLFGHVYFRFQASQSDMKHLDMPILIELRPFSSHTTKGESFTWNFRRRKKVKMIRITTGGLT